MASVYEIVAQIKLILTGKGGKEAADQLDDTKKKADSATKSVDKLGKTLTKYLGGALLLRFAQQSVKAFAAWERQLNAIGMQLERLGIESAIALPRVKAFLEALEASSGILRQDAAVAFQKFLGVIKDVDAAMLLTTTTAGTANSGLKDFAAAANLLGSVLLGEVIEPAKSLGIAFDQTKNSALQQSAVMFAAIEAYKELAKAQKDAQGSLDSLAASQNAVSLTLGEQLAPAVKFVSDTVIVLIKSVQTVGAAFGRVVNGMLDGARFVGRVMGGLGDVIKAAFEFDLDEFADAYGEFGETIRETQTKLAVENAQSEATYAEQFKAIWGEAYETKIDLAKANAVIEKQVTERALALEKKGLEEVADEERKAAEERAAFDEKIQDQMLRAKISAAKDGSQEQLDLELEMLERLKKRAVDAAREKGADVAGVEELFREMERQRQTEFDEETEEQRIERAKEFAERQLDLKQDLIDAELELVKEGSDEQLRLELEALELEFEEKRKLYKKDSEERAQLDKVQQLRAAAITKRHADDDLKWSEMTAKQKMELSSEVAAQSVSLGRMLFGESKALAVADTIISTARGVMRASPIIPLMALIAATGAVQVAKILSTEPGSGGTAGAGIASGGGGFDSNAAQSVPRRSTGPGTDEFDNSSPEPGSGPSPGVGPTYVFNGPNIVDEASLRRFDRRLKRAARRDQSRAAL